MCLSKRIFDPWPVGVRLLVGKVALGQVLLGVIRRVPVSINQQIMSIYSLSQALCNPKSGKRRYAH
jgi:hypothetical protein